MEHKATPGDRKGSLLGKLGELEVRLAQSDKEVLAAQRLRFNVFYGEMDAVADERTERLGRDDDPFDAICDHLIVIDRSDTDDSGEPLIVATSRLLRQDAADAASGFYSSAEFDIDGLVARNPGRRFLELGRSCVLKPYRTKRTVELMWHGIWRYFLRHDLDVMVGCGSLHGVDTTELSPQLALLGEIAPAPDVWKVAARPGLGIPLADHVSRPDTRKQALRALPPLIKGYLRLGAYVCEEACIDRQFGTTDVFLVLPMEAISARYIRFYGAEANRYAA